MKDVRFQDLGDKQVAVDVVCSCGRQARVNKFTHEDRFKHRVELGGHSITLVCQCGKEYLVRPQVNHVHVSEL